ncbi:hypothetical protein [Antrihabitans cavernicola]|uniref:Uncharacterized protein n=1 Tax=Antrihabitans cavernicola TaxID=2495913 RepID=A0A5A7SAG3_9NOCA|nr:hypothetical protein [Spelaeibacter cavernicola]KAA0021827.1 hypothetical protein FOY51_15635 [Spelaeibacter cavernicola]
MNTQLDDNAFVAAVRTLAGDAVGFVYRADMRKMTPDGSCECKYAETREGVVRGSCLIGQALLAAGAPLAEVSALDRLSDSNADYVLPNFGLSCKVIDWAASVQSSQDAGEPWGQAVADADARYGDPLA